MPKLSTIAELARDSTRTACQTAIGSLQKIKPPDDDDGSYRAVLRRIEYAITQADECIEENATQITENVNPLDACAITATGAITGVAAEIARSLIQVKKQRDLLLKVVQTYANAENYERGRMFRPCTKDENLATGKSQAWDAGQTARDAIGLIKSTWMPIEPTDNLIEDQLEVVAKNPANYDELLPPIDGGILFVPKAATMHESICSVGGSPEKCHVCGKSPEPCAILPHIKVTPSKILEY